MRCAARDIVSRMMKLLHSLGYKIGKGETFPGDMWTFYVYPPDAPEGEGKPIERRKPVMGLIPSPSIGARLPSPSYALTVVFDQETCDFFIKDYPSESFKKDVEKILRSMRP